MTHEQALDKVARLLRLAKSDNPHEAALAASKAQDIIDRYKLGEVALDYEKPKPEEPIKEFEAPLDGESHKSASTWKIRLAVSICESNQCKVILRGGAILLIGRPSDAESVRYLYAWLAQEVDRLAERDAKGNGKSWANNFRLGVVDAIGAKVAEQKTITQNGVRTEAFAKAGESALVRVEQSIVALKKRAEDVEEWTKKNLKLRKRTTARTQYHPSAREAGMKAGEEIRLGSAKGGLGSGQKVLT